MVVNLEVEAGKGANDSRSDNALLRSVFEDYERCRVPYSSYVSSERHDEIRHKVETWLFDNEVLSAQRIQEIHGQHLLPCQWDMIKDNPESYWPELFASRMNAEERAKVDKGPYRQSIFQNQESYRRYLTSSLVWTGVAEILYHKNSGRFPSPDEELEIVQTCSGPHHACFFVLAEKAANLEVNYSWGKGFLEDWKDKKQKYEQEHPTPKKSQQSVAA
jgi:hypothetical protein